MHREVVELLQPYFEGIETKSISLQKLKNYFQNKICKVQKNIFSFLLFLDCPYFENLKIHPIKAVAICKSCPKAI